MNLRSAIISLLDTLAGLVFAAQTFNGCLFVISGDFSSVRDISPGLYLIAAFPVYLLSMISRRLALAGLGLLLGIQVLYPSFLGTMPRLVEPFAWVSVLQLLFGMNLLTIATLLHSRSPEAVLDVNRSPQPS
jgi:hypothetical protein